MKFSLAPLLIAGLAVSIHAAEKPVKTEPAHPFTNRLAKEKSPYLLQHAHNPVDWYPWGAEAFEKARREDKPIFLSVGYSTCHWCHVMEHESFENEAIAKILNDHFVSIKVDREERPDVDRVYMTFVQATTGGGGWPMSVFLTPDLKPFLGGTYFPPDDRYGQPGFPTMLKRIADAWKSDRQQLIDQGNEMVKALRDYAAGSAGGGGAPDKEILKHAFDQIVRSFDQELGGFGGAPKFPRPVTLNFLFRVYAREHSQSALEMNLLTLQKMAAGGMHDHIGGGFHRYSVDRFWHVPHFEKMLYDQAQLAISYLDAFQVTRDPQYERVARDILDYVRRDMTDSQGGFYSAEDADSPVAVAAVYDRRGAGGEGGGGHEASGGHRPPLQEKKEGAFYVWTKKEIEDALGPDDAQIFNRFYGVEEAGNAPGESDPRGELDGQNILIEKYSVEQVAKIYKKTPEEVEKVLANARRKLFELRAKRPRPHLDDKIITAWNGLMISAFARAAQALDDAAYLDAATRAAKFVRAHLAKDGALIRSYREGASDVAGFADDYAFFIQGLLDLYEASFDVAWLKWAAELQAKQDELFADKNGGGYFSVTDKDPHILLRMKEDYDGAEPSPNSVAALNLLRLSQVTGSDALKREAEKTISAFAQQLDKMPTAMPQMLVALDFSLGKPKQIVIAGKPGAPDTRALLREVHAHFIPNKILLLADGGEGQQWLGERLEFIKTAAPLEGNATAFVCENFVCQLPTSDVKKLSELLKAR
jgi:uncharacterized protein